MLGWGIRMCIGVACGPYLDGYFDLLDRTMAVYDPHRMDRRARRVPLPPAKPPVRELVGPTTYAAGAFPALAMR